MILLQHASNGPREERSLEGSASITEPRAWVEAEVIVAPLIAGGEFQVANGAVGHDTAIEMTALAHRAAIDAPLRYELRSSAANLLCSRTSVLGDTFMTDRFPKTTSHDANVDASSSGSEDLVAGAKKLVRETAAQASETLGAARDSVQDTFRAAKGSVADARATVVDKASIAGKAAHGYVSANPWMAVSAAAAVGVAIGMLIRRR
jgi:ElaB/YqjD/DUF883 family membrane-anchored ribosome-binding protein